MAKSREEINEYYRNWRLNNPERAKAIRAKWYAENKDFMAKQRFLRKQ